jgi:predicted anti-sigma-YlaC factor YlaD
MAKSEHLPFEDWLLHRATLNPAEKQSLLEHLRNCDSCRQLSTSLYEVESRLRAAPAVAPSPGFTNRWLARLDGERQKIHRRQTLAILLFYIGGAAVVLASLGLLAVQYFQSPVTFFWSWLYRLMTLVELVSGAEEMFRVSLRTLIGLIPLAGWVLFFGILSELAVIWFVTLRLLTNPRRVSS